MSIKRLLYAMLTLNLIVGYCQAQIDSDKIVGIWLLDEGEGNITEDASGNARKGTITQGNWQKGKFGAALEIEKGGTVTIPIGKGTIIDKVTFTLWLQFTDLAGQQNYFSIWDQSNNRYVPYKTDANLLRSWTNTWNISSGITVNADTWYHVANVYDGKTGKIYINGEEKVSQNVPRFTLQDQDQTAWLATDRGTGFLSACIMDDVGLFNEALTEDEIQDIMNNGVQQTAFAVQPLHKLAIRWGHLKNQ